MGPAHRGPGGQESLQGGDVVGETKMTGGTFHTRIWKEHSRKTKATGGNELGGFYLHHSWMWVMCCFILLIIFACVPSIRID